MSKKERYVIKSLGRFTNTFSRVGQKSGEIQINKDYVNKLTKDEIEVNVLWCEERRKNHKIPEKEVDKKVLETCRVKGLEKSLLSVLVKQGTINSSEYIMERIQLLKEIY
jgi:hypothetical protein